MLDEKNVLVMSFRMAKEKNVDENSTEVKLRQICRRGQDAQIYNLPSMSEVAALVAGDFDDSLGDRDILVETHVG